MIQTLELLLLLAIFPYIEAHGFMVRPAIWGDPDRIMWATDKNGDSTDLSCGTFDLPKDTEFEIASGREPDCQNWWSSIGNEIPGEPTIPVDLIQPNIDCAPENTEELHEKFPWSAPGTTPVYSPCGAMGGFPYGCEGMNGDTYQKAEKFGDICLCDGVGRPTQIHGCGSFAYGGLAHQYTWPNAPITTWKAGSVQEVAWYLPSPQHGGGYAYRLCKTPEEGISGLTEEICQNGHLEFFENKQWMYYNSQYMDSEPTTINATRINKGTFPPGSMWTVAPFDYPSDLSDVPLDEVEDQNYFGHTVDKVKIPSSLEPGEYVLSFRWDSKCTSQVFSSCANINITN